MKIKKILKNILTLTCVISLFTTNVNNINSYASNNKLVSATDSEVNNSGLMKIVNGFTELDYGSNFHSIKNTSDKGVILCGTDSRKAFVAKFDKNGNLSWGNKIGDEGKISYTKFYNAIETSDGGTVAVGYSSSKNIGFENMFGDNFPIIVKYNQDGQQEWIKHVDKGDGNARFNSVIELEDGSLVAVGADKGSQTDAIIVKYSSTGEVLKTLRFAGAGGDNFSDIIQLKDGSFIVVGDTSSKQTIQSIPIPDGGAIILKYDSELNLQWGSSYGSSTQFFSQRFNKVLEMSDGNIAVIGNLNAIVFYNPEGVKIGELTWSEYLNELYSIKNTIDGGFIILAGPRDDYYNEGMALIKFDKHGQKEWVEYVMGNDSTYANDVLEISEDNYVAIGSTYCTDLGFENEPYNSAPFIVQYKKETPEAKAETAVVRVENEPTVDNMINARSLVNNLDESDTKDNLQNRLNVVEIQIELTKKNATANLDIYIKSENMLSLSLSTNSITFDDFGGTENLEKENAVILTVNSSLPYKVNASLASEIQNADKSETMNKEILNIKANGELDEKYQHFTAVDTPIEIVSTQEAGNGKTHGIDIMLKGGIPHEKDIYKTTIKFEATQH